MKNLYDIQISQELNYSLQTELFSILEQLLPIKFCLCRQYEIVPDGLIVRDGSNNINEPNTPNSLSITSYKDSVNKSQEIKVDVEFADDPDVPFPFRGRKVSSKLAQVESVLVVRRNEKVLAVSEFGPIWLVSEINNVKHFRSALALPHIAIEQNFNDVFNEECFLEMLVFLQFIRAICNNMTYQHAPLRASFIIDDPNLHWPRYGYVDYRKIVEHAKKENYHVAFATIPLDTWYTHSATASLFRENSRYLSLLIHGNNHGKMELAHIYSEKIRRGLLLQAIWRIKRLEQKSKLRVCRVMVPPHGACSEKMLAELPNCGFESACISAGSLRAHNQGKPWTKTLGFFPAEIIQGCPVLPRWGLSGKVKNTLLLAAYLGQPMIIRGHHQDLKNGGEVFDEYAKFINGFGNVHWSNITDLSRLNYLWKIEGTACIVKPLGMNVTFELPKEVIKVIIESPGEIDNCGWQVTCDNRAVHKIMPGEHLILSENMDSNIVIERNVIPQLPLTTETFKPTNAALILRRLLTEARDRFLCF